MSVLTGEDAGLLLELAGRLRFAARLLAKPPDEAVLAGAAEAGLLDAGPPPGLEAVQVEFTRLFAAPGPEAIRVHQSAYTDMLTIEPAGPADGSGCGVAFPGGEFRGYLGGPSCQEARRWYAEAGYAAPEDEMADHVSIELGFAAHLAEAEAADMEAGRGPDAAAWRELRERFCGQFLGRWLGEFAARVASNASSGFYRRAGRFIQDEVMPLLAGGGR